MATTGCFALSATVVTVDDADLNDRRSAAIDLERKLEEFRTYYNENRVHQSLSGRTPVERSGVPPPACRP
jgi:transposase InsO family protein